MSEDEESSSVPSYPPPQYPAYMGCHDDTDEMGDRSSGFSKAAQAPDPMLNVKIEVIEDPNFDRDSYLARVAEVGDVILYMLFYIQHRSYSELLKVMINLCTYLIGWR